MKLRGVGLLTRLGQEAPFVYCPCLDKDMVRTGLSLQAKALQLSQVEFSHANSRKDEPTQGLWGQGFPKYSKPAFKSNSFAVLVVPGKDMTRMGF